MPSDLISWWRFENNFLDEKGINNGTSKNGAQIINSTERGNVLSLDGINNYVDYGNDSSLKGAAPKTFLAWFKIQQNVSGSFGSWIAGNEVASQGGALYIATTRYPALMSSNGIQYYPIKSPSPVNLNQWYHLVGSNNGTTAFVYVNGVLNKTMNVGMSTAIDKFVIGTFYRRGSPQRYFNGTIDEVMVFNRTLSPNEILAIYNSQK